MAGKEQPAKQQDRIRENIETQLSRPGHSLAQTNSIQALGKQTWPEFVEFLKKQYPHLNLDLSKFKPQAANSTMPMKGGK